MTSIFDDLKMSFRHGSALTKVIFVNLGVFILYNLLASFSFLLNSNPPDLINWLAVPAYLPTLLTRPWTLISYMFLHEGFMHLLFNMIWLYFGGRIFQDLLGEHRFMSTYIMGGLSGAFLYILAYNLFPVFGEVLPIARAMGASASILAIIVAIGTKVPNYTVNLLFIGPVKLKYIAIFSVLIDLISFHQGNAGGHIAHLGGALFGFMYIRQLEKGKDIGIWYTKWVNTLKSLFTRSNKQHVKVVYRKQGMNKKEATRMKNEQEAVDIILDKISKSGYDSLTKEEKDLLFRASQKN
jgi:membrane associated rhomboid family serine protease